MWNILKQLDKTDFLDVFKLMQEAFPDIEMRTKEGQEALLDDPHYKLYGSRDEDGELLGFLGVCEIEDFIYIDHFAVNKKYRGQGIGAMYLSQLKEKTDKLILEVELPDTDIAKRRVEFYEREGFNYNDYEYLQPPLQKGNPFYPLRFMTFPREIDEKAFEYHKKLIYKVAYKYSE